LNITHYYRSQYLTAYLYDPYKSENKECLFSQRTSTVWSSGEEFSAKKK